MNRALLSAGIILPVAALAAEVPDVITEYSPWLDVEINHPVFSRFYSKNVDDLRQDAASVLRLSEQRLLELLPEHNGAYYVACPHPGCLNLNGASFVWALDRPDEMVCSACGTVFPNPDYPLDHVTRVVAPSGNVVEFPYYQSGDKRHYLRMHLDYSRLQYFAARAKSLAQLYHASGDETAGRRAAIILCQIAKHFPDYVYKYDLQFNPTAFIDGPPTPEKFGTGNWEWSCWWGWGWCDIPDTLLFTYDILMAEPRVLNAVAADMQVDIERDIVQGFLLTATRYTLMHRDTFHNMSPHLWRCLMIVARVTGQSDFFHIAIRRTERFMRERFRADGAWKEASADYHDQCWYGIRGMLDYASGFSDPPGPLSRYAARRYSGFSPAGELPLVASAARRSAQWLFPDHSRITLGDTRYRPDPSRPPFEQPGYLAPNYGMAMLAGGAPGNPTQLLCNFSAKDGHHHFDLLELVLHADGRERLSDLGYTHTWIRPYTLTTAAHNTVLADRHGQTGSGHAGVLEYLELDYPGVRLAAVDGRDAYPQLSEYRRTSFLVALGHGADYIADFFIVSGAETCFDYFLHGDAEEEDVVTAVSDGRRLSGSAFDFLDAAERAAWKPAAHEGAWEDHGSQRAYGYFSDVQHLEWPGNAPAEIAFVNPGGGALNIWVPAGDPRPALYTGRAPAMRGIYGPDPSRRGADEDLRLIDRFKRRFLCLRLPARGTPSTFATVIETKAGTVRSVNRLGDRVLLVASSNRTDLVFTHVHEPLQVAIGKRTATIAGAYGYLAVDAVGTVVDYYLVDGAIELDGKTFVRTRGPASLTLLDSDGGPTARFVPGELDAARLSRFCRFVLPGGEVYGNLLAAVDPASGRATLLENTGFVPDRPNWRWLSYPLGPIVGGITVELFPRATGNPCPWPEPEAVPPGRASR